nr:M48 family metallopeptidase [Endozoicomonas sp.]
DRLVSHVGVFRQDARSWQWEVNLITDKQLNAYCMPGGKIMFYTGIIDTLKLTDDEIAAIMGHEMAHALREHGREAMSQAYAVQLGQDTLAILLGVSPGVMSIGSSVVNYALTLPNSRTNEAEADLIGLELMARAGYNPRAAVTLWQKMSAQSSKNVPEFMSTHPAHDTRINGLRANIPKVEHLYNK